MHVVPTPTYRLALCLSAATPSGSGPGVPWRILIVQSRSNSATIDVVLAVAEFSFRTESVTVLLIPTAGSIRYFRLWVNLLSGKTKVTKNACGPKGPTTRIDFHYAVVRISVWRSGINAWFRRAAAAKIAFAFGYSLKTLATTKPTVEALTTDRTVSGLVCETATYEEKFKLSTLIWSIEASVDCFSETKRGLNDEG